MVKHHRWTWAVVLVTALVMAPLVPATAGGRVPTSDESAAATKWLGGSPQLTNQTTLRAAAVSQLAVRPKARLKPCAEDPAFLCGAVRVPVDRARPNARSIRIGFAIYPHRSGGPGASDPILVTAGGPGASATDERYFWQFVLDPLLNRRDLLLIDNRGTGKSAPIVCPGLQNGVSGHDDFIAAIGACGARLGDDADRYGAGDIAKDIEAVRRALGYPRLNYFAASAATVAAQAYAVRFPQRLRAVVLDAGMPVNDRAHRWTWGQAVPGAMTRSATLSCRRAPACAAAQPDAGRALGQLARAVRRQPIHGAARDADGVLRRVHVGELRLAAIAWAEDPFTGGELAAAADALAAGDKKPLLRLAAETPFGPGDAVDPAVFSAGHNAAAFCNDANFVWNRNDPVHVRLAKYRRALAALAPDTFAPFWRKTFTTLYVADFCLRWPAPDRFVPAVPRGATVTGVPAMLLGGDLDTNVPAETTRALLRVFPDATFVDIAGALHPASGWSDCARSTVKRFVRTLDARQARCDKPAFVAPAVPKFPTTSAQATPATPMPADDSTARDHRVVTVAVRAVLDAWLRSFRQPDAVATGPGLRGGTFDADYASFADHAVLDLHGVRFSQDVAVRGDTTLRYADNVVRMDIRVSGPRGHSGKLTARGLFGFGQPFRTFRVTGSLGGHQVAVRVPAN